MSMEQQRAAFEAWWNSPHVASNRMTNRELLEQRVMGEGWAEYIWNAAIEADRKLRTPPNEPFVIVVDRMYEGEGPSLAYWNGENYQFSDGDCFDREGDTLDGYTAEFLTDHQLKKRLFDDRQRRGEPKDRRDIRGIVKKLQSAYVKDGSTDEWIRLRRHVLEEAIDTLRLVSDDCAHFYDAYKAACERAPQPAEPTVKESLTAAEPVKVQSDDDLILIPRGLVGAACSAIDKKRDAPKVLAELHRYTTGDLARYGQPAQPASGMVSVTQADANAYCRILSLLGMEEEGDAVAEVERLVAVQPAASAEPFGHIWRTSDTTARIELAGDPHIKNGTAVYAASVAAQPSVPKWIPVTERLPEIIEHSHGSVAGTSEYVLVLLNGEADDRIGGGKIDVWRYFRGGRGDLTSTFWDYDNPEVTHWMPLPTPPTDEHSSIPEIPDNCEQALQEKS